MAVRVLHPAPADQPASFLRRRAHLASIITPNYFTTLGVSPAAGRLFGPGDGEQEGGTPIVVLSHRFWTRRFQADPSVVGQTFKLNGQAFSVVGVASEGFQGTNVLAADLWVPAP